MGATRPHFIPDMLAHQAMFRALTAQDLGWLAEGATERVLSKQELIYQKGESPQEMYLVITGQIKLTLSTPAGMETIVYMAGPGDSFGEETVFPGGHAPLSAQANKDSLVISLGQAALRNCMAHSPEFAEVLLGRMGKRMCQLIENLETCVQRNSAQRVAHFLSQRAPDRVSSFDLELDVNKSTIASQLNLAPETFSRVLNRLSREGLIDLKGRHITLRNLESLRAYAG